MTTDQLNKLPKWAQTEIKVLRSDNQSLKIKLNEMFGEAETNTYIEDLLDKKPLIKDASISFSITGGTVRCRVDRFGNLDINSDSRVGKSFSILPNASNSITIKFI